MDVLSWHHVVPAGRVHSTSGPPERNRATPEGPPALGPRATAADAGSVPERLERLRRQLADDRGGRVVLLSHCLLDENVRYLGGAGGPGGVQAVVDRYLSEGIGVYQLPCPERHAWGGALKRRMLIAYGAGGTVRAPLARLLLRPFLTCTGHVYARLARGVGRDVLDYRRSGVEVVGVVGIAGSPSCGVRTTLDLTGAVDVLSRCPLARLDRSVLNRDVVAANETPGEGMFMCALRRRLDQAGARLPFEEVRLPEGRSE